MQEHIVEGHTWASAVPAHPCAPRHTRPGTAVGRQCRSILSKAIPGQAPFPHIPVLHGIRPSLAKYCSCASMHSQHKHIHVQAPFPHIPVLHGIRPSLAKKKATRLSSLCYPVLLDGLFHGFGRGQTEDLPVLHAAPIPLDLVCRVTEFQQVLDIVGGLATPHTVTEHDQGLGTGIVP